MAGSITPEKQKPTAIDRFAASRAAILTAFIWGLAEAAVFFIVPDVLLTLLGARALKPALKASAAALVGALAGGAVMYALAAAEPEAARRFIESVPAISPALIDRVASQVDTQGLLALMIGPIKGIPYKIYAVEWGARDAGLIKFLLVSIPARYTRFLLSALAARAVARLIGRWTRHRAEVEMTILLILWVGFYGFYFSRFGW